MRKRSGSNRRPRQSHKAGANAPNHYVLYHLVYEDEGFETAATMLFDLVHFAAQTAPGKLRRLYLDIKGHRNEHGGYNNDRFELQQDFVLGILMPYLSEVHLPLLAGKNSRPQRDDIPDELTIFPAK